MKMLVRLHSINAKKILRCLFSNHSQVRLGQRRVSRGKKKKNNSEKNLDSDQTNQENHDYAE